MTDAFSEVANPLGGAASALRLSYGPCRAVGVGAGLNVRVPHFFCPPVCGDGYGRNRDDEMKCHANAYVKASAIISALILVPRQAESATYYVDAARPNDGGLATNWVTAKKSIQAAVKLAVDGDTVIVTNGVYASGTTVTPGSTLNNRVVITNAITVRSVNGPDVTVIEGSGTNFYNTSSAVRCVYMNNGTLDGFTLRSGATKGAGDSSLNVYDETGGGVNIYNAAPNTVVTNCIIQNCKAKAGGGAAFGTLNNCTLSGNTAYAYSSSSSPHSYGGGSYNCTLNNCTLSGNTAYAYSSKFSSYSYGGGSYAGTLNNCTLMGNTSSDYGGGSYNGTLNNCTLTDNTSSFFGGGSSDGTLNNCTLSGNRAQYGGGSYDGTLRNCIVWGNTNSVGAVNNYESSDFFYSCTYPMPSLGEGNISSDPMFLSAQDLHLRPGSPCIDGGLNSCATLPTDLDGNPRIQNGVVDMGAYEDGVFNMVVTFDARGGTVPVPASKTVTYGQVYGSLATTTRTGYYGFAGWYTNAACTGAVVTDSTTVAIAGDHSLFAKWVEQATSLGPVPVPYSWLIQYPVLMSMASGNFEIAALIDADLDGVITWQEYVAGSVPTDNASVFRAGIDVIGGEPQVSWTPDLGAARVYTVEGKTNLTDAEWGPTNAGSRFFRVKVDMP